jgi:hypothetical protein
MRIMTADPLVVRAESPLIFVDPESDVDLRKIFDKVVAVFGGKILYEQSQPAG